MSEQITMIAKKSKMLISVLLIAIFIIAITAGCKKHPLTAKEAVGQLIQSITYKDNKITFTVPANYPDTTQWNILVAGRLEEDGFGMSVHLFSEENENKSWVGGQTYSIEIKSGYTELLMSVSLPDEDGNTIERSIDLLNVDDIACSK